MKKSFILIFFAATSFAQAPPPQFSGLMTVTVSSTAACAISSSCHYSLTRSAANSSAAIGNLSVGTISAGSSFVINSLSATDTVATTDVSSVSWQIN
jgi:hypothetical protein